MWYQVERVRRRQRAPTALRTRPMVGLSMEFLLRCRSAYNEALVGEPGASASASRAGRSGMRRRRHLRRAGAFGSGRGRCRRAAGRGGVSEPPPPAPSHRAVATAMFHGAFFAARERLRRELHSPHAFRAGGDGVERPVPFLDLFFFWTTGSLMGLPLVRRRMSHGAGGRRVPRATRGPRRQRLHSPPCAHSAAAQFIGSNLVDQLLGRGRGVSWTICPPERRRPLRRAAAGATLGCRTQRDARARSRTCPVPPRRADPTSRLGQRSASDTARDAIGEPPRRAA